MKKKGQVFFLALMLGLVFILLGLAFAPTIKEFSDTSRNASTDTTVGLDCANSSISNFDKANCVAVDMFNPYFAGFLILAGGAIIGAKFFGG